MVSPVADEACDGWPLSVCSTGYDSYIQVVIDILLVISSFTCVMAKTWDIGNGHMTRVLIGE